MRLSSTSSSLILATLAVSSSSVALAAPTEPGALEEATAPSSSDLRVIAMAGRSDGVAIGMEQTSLGESDMSAAQIQAILARRGLLDTLGGALSSLPLVGPILGPLLQTLGSLASGLGLPLDALQTDAVDAGSVPPLTPEQIHHVAAAIALAHSQMQALVAHQGNLTTRGRIAEWDAVSDPPASSSSTSDVASATPSSTSSVPMQRSQTEPTTSSAALTTSSSAASNATTSASGNNTAPTALPINPPNTPNMPSVPTPQKPGGIPALVALASRMMPPLFIKAGQNKVEVSMSDGPATTFTANASSTANYSSAATPTSDATTTLTSAAAANSTSTTGPSDYMFSRTHTT